MRVAVVQSTWTPHSVARTRALRERAGGHTVEVITVAGGQKDYDWTVPNEGLTPPLFPADEYWGLRSRRVRSAVGAALDRIDPEVVVLPGWGFSESVGGLAWAIRARRRRVLVSDSTHEDLDRHGVKEWVKRRLISSFDAAFVGGSRHVRYLGGLGFTKACFPGCDVVDNAHFAQSTTSQPGEPVLLSCVRLLERKNIPFVLEVLSSAPGWRWRIAGDGPERETIERVVAQRGLGDRVELLGSVPYDDLPQIYGSAHVYLQPSLSEPWGLAVNEAMSAGLPVLVSSRCGCADDLVEDGRNGFTFDPTDQNSFESALARMVDRRSEWSSMGEASRATIAHWDLNLYASNLLASCANALADSVSDPVIAKLLAGLMR